VSPGTVMLIKTAHMPGMQPWHLALSIGVGVIAKAGVTAPMTEASRLEAQPTRDEHEVYHITI